MDASTTFPASGDRNFRTTAWSVIREAQGGDASGRDRAMDRLISVCWRPVYWSLRFDWNAPAEEARDLTQEYFSAFLEKRMVEDLAPDRGRFRAYVKATLKNFMLTHKRDQAALKRGGGRSIVALENLREVEAHAAEAAQETPDRRFDREWMRSVVHEALEALEAAYARDGKPQLFSLFQTYYLGESSGTPVRYEELSVKFGLGPHDVKNRLAEARARFRETVLAILRDGVSSEDELLGEIQEVFGP